MAKSRTGRGAGTRSAGEQPTRARNQAAASRAPERYITEKELRELLGGISAMTVWRWERDSRVALPRRVRLGVNRVAWPLSKIEAWLAARAATGAPAA